jgi:hypothetical protein
MFLRMAVWLAVLGCTQTHDSGAVDSDVDVRELMTVGFEATDDDFLNPERGFYGGIDLVGSHGIDGIRPDGMTLAYDGVRLDAYRDSALDADFLASLDDGFASARAAGIEVVLRFVYNDGPDADASKAQILGHLEQLAPVLADNADVIAVMQAGFIGAWGEWHDSTNGLDNAADRAEILDGILRALPDSRMTQVRTPMFKADAYGGPLVDGFDGSDAARVGHHDDCFLASDTDFGTYDDPIEDWKDFVAQEGRFTPVGGETCAVDPPRSECASAMAELERLHWSFLNSGWNPDVLASWTDGGCMPEIRRRLGYRFELHELRVSDGVQPGGVLHVELDLENVGYAALFNARPALLVLDDGAGDRYETALADDPRRWEPGPVTVTADVQVPADAHAGTWRLSLWLPDASPALASRPEYAVRLANAGIWDEGSGLNVLTEVAIAD